MPNYPSRRWRVIECVWEDGAYIHEGSYFVTDTRPAHNIRMEREAELRAAFPEKHLLVNVVEPLS